MEVGPIPPWNLRGIQAEEETVTTDDLEFFLDINEDEVGMTEARQENIQRALKNLMGHSKAGVITGSSAAEITADMDPSAMSVKRRSLGTKEDKRQDWECTRCTLINVAASTVCAACGLSL